MVDNPTHSFTTRPPTMSEEAWRRLFPISAGTPPNAAIANAASRPTPGWLRDAVVYELFPRQFSASGDFAGVIADLDRLQRLGVTILWLMPVNPIGEARRKGRLGSPYAVRDYLGVNAEYGTVDELQVLVREAHRRGIRVMLDVVLNHTSWDNTLLDRPGFHLRDGAGVPRSPLDWDDVVGLDYANAEVRAYMTEMLAWWVRELDVDGFRADVAWNLPVDFWEEARTALERIKPEIVMLAEAERPELLVRAFDFDYAWAVYHAMASVIEGERPATHIREAWEHERRSYGRGALHLRFSDDHDEKRAIARFGERAALAAAAFTFLIDGVPLIYNGMEAGDVTESTAPALFERLPVFWEMSTRRPDFPRFYEVVVPFRRASPALRDGDTEWLANSDEDRVVTFARRDAGESLVVAINFSNRPFAGRVSVGGSFLDVTPGATPRDDEPLPALSLAAWEWRVFRASAPG